MKYKCLSIAGFDGSGGAGIQADLKTFSALGCYGMTVLTALPIQNTQGVKRVVKISLSCIQEQLEALFEDIRPDSIKIGMLFSSEIIELIAHFLKKNALGIPVILDPVMTAKSGDLLLQKKAVRVLKQKLIPLATLITPNLPEAKMLVGNLKSLEDTGKKLLGLGVNAVLLKGGHANSNSNSNRNINIYSRTSNDLLMDQFGAVKLLKAKRIISKNTHGTGCTLSAAICAFVARENNLLESCKAAKQYLTGTIRASKNNSVGKGNGPVHHFYDLW